MNRTKVLWLVAALLLLVPLIFFCVRVGWPAAVVTLAAAILPDVTLIGAFAGNGLLKRSRVGAYNFVHSPSLPLAFLAISIVLLFIGGWWPLAVISLAWLLHIAVDRVAGYGLREPDGSIRPVGATRAANAVSAADTAAQ